MPSLELEARSPTAPLGAARCLLSEGAGTITCGKEGQQAKRMGVGQSTRLVNIQGLGLVWLHRPDMPTLKSDTCCSSVVRTDGRGWDSALVWGSSGLQVSGTGKAKEAG